MLNISFVPPCFPFVSLYQILVGVYNYDNHNEVNKTPKKAKKDKQNKKNKTGKTTKKDNAGNKNKKDHKGKHTAKNATTDTHVTTDKHNKTPSTFADKVAKRARRAESPPAHELPLTILLRLGPTALAIALTTLR